MMPLPLLKKTQIALDMPLVSPYSYPNCPLKCPRSFPLPTFALSEAQEVIGMLFELAALAHMPSQQLLCQQSRHCDCEFH